MPDIQVDVHNKLKGTITALQKDRLPWWRHWRELADFYLPRRYIWLLSENEARRIQTKNPFILDGTGTQAARTLASGMMNGITSPSRPWFKLRVPAFGDSESYEVRQWLDEVERRMLLIMAESNFYNALAVMYLDLVVFGTAAMLIYEDNDAVIRCYNPALGEYYLGQGSDLKVNIFAREFSYKVHQIVERWGEENCSETVKSAYRQGGAQLHTDISITHMIEPNRDKVEGVSKRSKAREWYWETNGPVGKVLERRGFNEYPVVAPRWELVANDSYGSSPAMDALGDVIQLQHETKAKGKGLDYMNEPPVVADIQLKNKPTALLPRGVTYVAGVNNIGAKPIYTVNPPIGEITIDIREIQARVRETFHNDLFRMISQLDTVRSATEIDARREEKLVLLGPVLERFENEGLDPGINRVFSIMGRSGLLPPAPPELEGADIEIQYVSILSSAQRAVGVIPIERWLQLVGNVAALYPKSVNVPNWDELIRDYGRDIGVPAKHIMPPEQTQALNDAQDQQAAMAAAAETGATMAPAAKQLSETQVGGGASALDRIMGG